MAFCFRSKFSVFRKFSFSVSKHFGSLRTPKCFCEPPPNAGPSAIWSALGEDLVKALHTSVPRLGDDITIHIETEYQTVTLKGAEGDSILRVLKKSDYEFQGFGACDGATTCSTCHVYFDQATYDAVNKGISEEELDMLCVVEEKKETSRLGCQVKLTKDLDGMTAILPLIDP